MLERNVQNTGVKERLYHYDVFRIIMTLFVVVGHLTFYNSPASRGGYLLCRFNGRCGR